MAKKTRTFRTAQRPCEGCGKIITVRSSRPASRCAPCGRARAGEFKLGDGPGDERQPPSYVDQVRARVLQRRPELGLTYVEEERRD